MSLNDYGTVYGNSRRSRFQSFAIGLLFAGLVLALAGDVYEFVKGEHRSRDMELMQHNLQAQITRLSDATSGAFDVTQQRFESVKKAQDSLALDVIRARSESREQGGQLTTRLEQKNQELEQRNRDLLSQLTALKSETAAKLQNTSARLQSASAKLDTTSAKVDTTSAKLERVSSDTERNRADLRRVSGDLGAVSVNVAKNTKDFAELRKSDERQRYEFRLLKTKVPTRVADIQIAVRGTDPRRNLYSMDLYADDRVAPEKNRAANEPVQLYVRGVPSPYEVVVTEVRKDEVVGYVSAPKPNGARLEAASATLK